MVRGISVGGVSLPVTDASLSFSKDPIFEQSMSGLGGETLYSGVIGSVQGSFSGAMRSSVVNAAKTILDVSPAASTIVVMGEGGALTASECYISSLEIAVKAGELAKISASFVGKSVTAGGSVGTADYSGEVPVFYNSSTTFGTCSGFSIKIDRPYTADDFILGDESGVSQSIYQSGETKVTGTITLSQTAEISTSNQGSLSFTLGTFSIAIANAAVNTGAEVSINGRGLVGKTYSWAAASDDVTIT
mgnify:FL=1